MTGIIILGAFVGILLFFWTKFNISEHNNIGRRWEEVLVAEDSRKNNFRKIKTAEVELINGETNGHQNVLYYQWDVDNKRVALYNAEDKAIAIFKLSEVVAVNFIREGEAKS